MIRPKEAVKRKTMGLAMIRERVAIINESMGKEIASFSLEEKTGAAESGTTAILVLPAYEAEKQDHYSI